MALSIDKTLDNGLVVPSAYIRVEEAKIYKKRLVCNLCVYKNNLTNIRITVSYFDCDYDLDGENPLRQAYLYLKTLPEFEGAEDV